MSGPRIEAIIARMERRIVDLEQRFDKVVRHGAVTDIDEKSHRVRLRIGGTDEKPLKSPWVPYGQIAGALKLHSMPSEGQTMTLLCPTGDFRQAVAIPLTWSDQNKSPSDKKGEHVLTFENVTVTLKKDSLKFAVGDASLELNKDFIKSLLGQSEHEIKPDRQNIKSDNVYVPVKEFVYLGVDDKDEKAGAKVGTEDGPARKAKAKV